MDNLDYLQYPVNFKLNDYDTTLFSKLLSDDAHITYMCK